MKKYSANQINEKLINHSRLKLTASLFMFLDNMRRIKTEKNPFIPFASPKEYDEIKQFILDTTKNLKETLSLPVDERIPVVEKLQNAKEDLISLSESFYFYMSMNSILAEVIAGHRRLKTIEASEEILIDFDGFFCDVEEFVESGDAPELQRINISYMMKCFPLFMTKEKYADYVYNGIMEMFENKSKGYILNVANALKYGFLPIELKGYGEILPELKDYFNTFLNLECEKMSEEELGEVLEDIVDTGDMLEKISDNLSLLYEAINYAILVISFSNNFDYLIDGKAIYKDAFYLICEKMDKEISEDDDLLSEACDEMFDDILIDLIDKIYADERSGFLDEENVKINGFSQDTAGLFKANRLISAIYYEMLEKVIYNVESSSFDQSEKADKEFIKKSINDILDYIDLVCKGLNAKMQKQIKRLFLSSFPSPFSVKEFMSYGKFVINNLTSYEKKMLILDNVGMFFESTGFMDSFDEEEHDHNHGEDCDCGHHH